MYLNGMNTNANIQDTSHLPSFEPYTNINLKHCTLSFRYTAELQGGLIPEAHYLPSPPLMTSSMYVIVIYHGSRNSRL